MSNFTPPAPLPEIWSVESAISQLGPKPFGQTFTQTNWGLWFRGHSNCTWQLIPSAHSRDGITTVDERSLAYDFRLRCDGQTHDRARNIFDLLCTMQHYGAPTRLLDWSESLLVALYFAVRDSIHWTTPGALYALNANALNEFTSYAATGGILPPEGVDVALRAAMTISTSIEDVVDLALKNSGHGWFGLHRAADFLRTLPEALNNPSHPNHNAGSMYLERLRYPVAVFPTRNNPRLIAQAGVFTIHGGKEYLAGNNWQGKKIPGPMPLDRTPCNYPFLNTYIIPTDAKQTIFTQLLALGINEGYLFPELEYQSIDQKRRWAGKYKELDLLIPPPAY